MGITFNVIYNIGDMIKEVKGDRTLDFWDVPESKTHTLGRESVIKTGD